MGFAPTWLAHRQITNYLGEQTVGPARMEGDMADDRLNPGLKNTDLFSSTTSLATRRPWSD